MTKDELFQDRRFFFDTRRGAIVCAERKIERKKLPRARGPGSRRGWVSDRKDGHNRKNGKGQRQYSGGGGKITSCHGKVPLLHISVAVKNLSYI